MLIDINLLQEKEKKHSHLLFIIVVIVSITLLFSAIFVFQLQSKKTKLEHLSAEIETTRQLREAKAQKIDVKGSVDSIETLQTAITWAEQNHVSAVQLIASLTQLLPKEGYIKSFDYHHDTIEMTAQLPDNKQAAYYLSHLNQADWIEHATILSISTKDEGKSMSYEVKYVMNLNLSMLKSVGNERRDAS